MIQHRVCMGETNYTAKQSIMHQYFQQNEDTTLSSASMLWADSLTAFYVSVLIVLEWDYQSVTKFILY